MQTLPRVYVAGPMSSTQENKYEYFNFAEFDKAQERLESIGFNVINPAQIDRAYGFHPERKRCDALDVTPSGMAHIFSRDLQAVSICDFIYFMAGWQDSKGANIEKLFSDIIGIGKLFYFDEDAFIEEAMLLHMETKYGDEKK